MEHAKPTATERSEGGSNPTAPRRRAILTEQVVVRISKNMAAELNAYAVMNELNVTAVVRRAVYLFLNPPEPVRRERFEETP